jgi:hypothetical protein
MFEYLKISTVWIDFEGPTFKNIFAEKTEIKLAILTPIARPF